MKVKTTVKAGAVVVGVGGILTGSGNNTGNSATGASSIGSNNQTGNGIQINLL
jgi:hypothetical protein